MEKPKQRFWGLWNLSFGFFGIQVAFALQNANVSRIFQTLGSDVEHLSILWIAGPITGLMVQPLIGHFSDRHWGRLGRRRPYFLAGALLTAFGMSGMPSASVLLIAAMLLWVMDASLNIAMEPFRAFVGDMVPESQQALGYSFQTAFIGSGAVLGSLVPRLLTMMGVPNVAAAGVVPDSVRYAFYIGATAIFSTVLWTVLSTREYSPEQMAEFSAQGGSPVAVHKPIVAPRNGHIWLGIGTILVAFIAYAELDKKLYVLGGGLVAFGLAQLLNRHRQMGGKAADTLAHILSDLATMPMVMRRLAVTQFFTWIALFIMWVYTTPVVTQYVFSSTDPTSLAYNRGADWVDVLFAIYNGAAALAAFLLPPLTRKFGASRTHMICLFLGAASFTMIIFIRHAETLMLPMVGIGIAWASILTMPYVILAATLPKNKLGIYMGIFNFFIVLPQLVIATIMGAVIKAFFLHDPIWTMLVAAIVLAIAALSMARVRTARSAESLS